MKQEISALSQALHDEFVGENLTLGTAESCTGGGVAQAIVSTPGASEYFKGGIVSYCNEVKERLLNVSHQTLEEQTAVCEEVARQMVIGACGALQVDFAVALTGLAGPGGGTPEIPVGTIWIGYGSKDDVHTHCLHGDYGREDNLERAKLMALQLITTYIHQNKRT
ncbi:MAG: CinA family protein [Prevotella sp.]|nr:CinA family protein [Prevotella sp.]